MDIKHTSSDDLYDNDIYDENWAKKTDNYIIGIPSSKILEDRKNKIIEIYHFHKQIKKIDNKRPGAINPKKWRDPPEYCYDSKLDMMYHRLKNELEELKNNQTDEEKNQQTYEEESTAHLTLETTLENLHQSVLDDFLGNIENTIEINKFLTSTFSN